MLSLHSIIVGVDTESLAGTRPGYARHARFAISTATDLLTGHAPSELTLLTAVGTEELVAAAESRLAPLAAEVSQNEPGALTVSSAVEVGTAEDVLAAAAQERSGDLVVLAARPMSASATARYGATAMAIARSAQQPVLLVRPGRIGLEATCAVLDRFDEASERALDAAVEFSLLQHLGLVVIHATKNSVSAPERQSCEARILDRLAETDFRSIAAGVIPCVASGRADRVAIDVAIDHDVDLLVIGTRPGSHEDVRLVDSLLSQADCSVLVVPHLETAPTPPDDDKPRSRDAV